MPSLKSTLMTAAALATLTLATTARAEAIYEIKQGEGKATAGLKGKTSLTITAKPGWHVNEEAPVSMKLTPDTGVTVEKPKLTKSDLAERTKEMARFDVAFTATEPGPKKISAEASFVMCQATTCKPVRETIPLALDVAPAKKK